jgi:hypothetical protein
MKTIKLLLFVTMIIIISSCVYTKPENTNVPSRVTNSIIDADTTQLISVYVVKDRTNIYYYSKDKKLIDRYDIDTYNISIDAVILIVIIFSLVFIIILISINY